MEHVVHVESIVLDDFAEHCGWDESISFMRSMRVHERSESSFAFWPAERLRHLLVSSRFSNKQSSLVARITTVL